MTKAKLIERLEALDSDLNPLYEDMNISCDLYSAAEEFQKALREFIDVLEEEPICFE